MISKVSALVLLAVIGSAVLSEAWAHSPTGRWYYQKRDAHLVVVACQDDMGKYCATIVGLGERYARVSSEFKSRLIGMPIARFASVSPSRWSGKLYNPWDDVNCEMTGTLEGSVLVIRLCVLGGLFCRRETWVRQPS